jgi:predicted Zn-dependent protease
LSFYQISLREQPGSIRLCLLLTSEHLSRHELAEAERVAARACDELPEYWEVWVSRSMVAMEQGKFEEAQRYLDRAAQTRGAPLGRIGGFMKRVQERRDTAQH